MFMAQHKILRSTERAPLDTIHFALLALTSIYEAWEFYWQLL
jgi:hypothetical protein